MDKRLIYKKINKSDLLLLPDFLGNNLEYVKKQASEEGLKLIQKSSNIPGIGITFEVIESGD